MHRESIIKVCSSLVINLNRRYYCVCFWYVLQWRFYLSRSCKVSHYVENEWKSLFDFHQQNTTMKNIYATIPLSYYSKANLPTIVHIFYHPIIHCSYEIRKHCWFIYVWLVWIHFKKMYVIFNREIYGVNIIFKVQTLLHLLGRNYIIDYLTWFML